MVAFGMVMKTANTFVCPKQALTFGKRKIERNKERDKKEQCQPAAVGWHCITIWEYQLNTLHKNM